MSFFQGDSRPGEQPAPPPRALTPVEVGVIIGTIAVFIAALATLFFYRNRKAKRRRAESRNVADDDDTQPDTGQNKNDDTSSREAESDMVSPSTRKKGTRSGFRAMKVYETDVERGEEHEMRDRA